MNPDIIPLVRHFIDSLNGVDYSVFAISLALIIFARPLLTRLSPDGISSNTIAFRVNLLRGLNIVIFIVYAYQYLYLPAEASGSSFTFLSILAILYISYFVNSVLQFLIQKRYGKARKIGEKTLYIETYQTRLFSILTAIIVSIVTIISIVHQLGFDSLLEAGGVLGILGVMLGLTQASWAPDIISGLIILNSDMFEEGDITEFDDGIMGRVYKTKLFHTEILNLSNNHRIMIRNAQLRDKIVHNLSKFASPRGLRECLRFKIGYDVPASNVKNLFMSAYDTATKEGLLESNGVDPDIKLLDTGDHALEWGFIFHVKNVENIVNIRRNMREIIFNVSLEQNLSLATPLTYQKLATPANNNTSKLSF